MATADPSPIVVESTPCWECGYELRGLESAGTCPECGQPIAISTGFAKPEFFREVPAKRIARALAVLAIAPIVFAPTGAMISYLMLTAPERYGDSLIVWSLMLAMPLGTWLLYDLGVIMLFLAIRHVSRGDTLGAISRRCGLFGALHLVPICAITFVALWSFESDTLFTLDASNVLFLSLLAGLLLQMVIHVLVILVICEIAEGGLSRRRRTIGAIMVVLCVLSNTLGMIPGFVGPLLWTMIFASLCARWRLFVLQRAKEYHAASSAHADRLPPQGRPFVPPV